MENGFNAFSWGGWERQSDKIARSYDLAAYQVKIRCPSLVELHALVAVAETGSLARAAERLTVTQGAVTRAINRLEEHLGRPVLDRHHRGSALTPAGKSYVEAVAPLLEGLERATLEVQGLQDKNVLRLSVIPTLASHWLIRRIPRFQQQHPHIRLQFVPYEREETHAFHGIDATIRGGDGASPEGIACEYLLGNVIVPVCKPLNPLRKAASPCALLRTRLLFHTSQPDAWSIWAAQSGCRSDGLDLDLGFDQASQLLEAAVAGLGTAIVQRCLLEDYLASERLVIACDRPVMNRRGYYLYYPARRRLRQPLVAFAAWLHEEAQATEPGATRATGSHAEESLMS